MLQFLVPGALSLGTALWGASKKKGDPFHDAQRWTDWMGARVPGLANGFYSAMMGGPMGRAMRVNAMQAGNAFKSGMMNSLAGTGGMNSGLGALGGALGGTQMFNLLAQGQGALSNLAWNGANNLIPLAMQSGISRANQMDAQRNALIGAGLGGLSRTAGDWSNSWGKPGGGGVGFSGAGAQFDPEMFNSMMSAMAKIGW